MGEAAPRPGQAKRPALPDGAVRALELFGPTGACPGGVRKSLMGRGRSSRKPRAQRREPRRGMLSGFSIQAQRHAPGERIAAFEVSDRAGESTASLPAVAQKIRAVEQLWSVCVWPRCETLGVRTRPCHRQPLGRREDEGALARLDEFPRGGASGCKAWFSPRQRSAQTVVRPPGGASRPGDQKKRSRARHGPHTLYSSARNCGDVAQLVRVPACHAGGCGFKSRHPRHSSTPGISPEPA